MGLKAPKAYIDAWAKLTIGLWYPDMDYRDSEAWNPYWEYQSADSSFEKQGYTVVKRKTPAFMQWLADFYEKIMYSNSYQKIPVFSMLLNSGILFWLLLIYIAARIYFRRYKLLFPVSAVVALWLTLMLGPVVLYRYVYPIVMTVPVLFAALVTDKFQKID